ncbi:MAG: PilZ domain-containing protein [Desulfobacterales bacterium]|nr:MAG: PilZ domain-containing protein [Desulfobacterales bacterium]
MLERVFITSKQTATFTCPQCQRTKTTDVSHYADMDRTVKVKMKCPCGHVHSVILEKRRQYRRPTDLPGTYVLKKNGRTVGKGLMTVRDVSTTGFQLELKVDQDFEIGAVLEVAFYLDDAQQTLIEKTVVIRNMRGNLVGTQLAPTETVGKALGFYLLK